MSDRVRPRARNLERASPEDEALFTDLYELTMLGAYLASGMREVAAFELFVRKLPRARGFLVAAGLEQALDYLEGLDIEGGSRRTADVRFTGDVDAIPEGTVVFENEPLVRVVAPIAEAQFVETRLLNLVHFQTVIASAAARTVLAAPGKLLVEFGARRAHGLEAGLLAARATYLAGLDGTSTVLAGERFGIPLYGTMAHSFVQAHDDELEAFRNFARASADPPVLLIDTYDTERGAEAVVALAREGVRVRGVRIDSGDLAAHAHRVRAILDAGGLQECAIFASGGLDEMKLRALVTSRAPIDGFGIGTRLDTSADAPYLDCVYKLTEYAGRARRKRSEGKATLPGRKQVHRRYDDDGRMSADVVTLVGDEQTGMTPLLVPVMRGGQRIGPPESLDAIRGRCADQLSRLPPHLRSLETTPPYPVHIAEALERLAADVDARTSTSSRGEPVQSGGA